MRRFATLSLFLLVAVCLASTTAFAQVRTAGQLVGVVEDPTGAVIPGAKVIVLSDTGIQKEVTSGADGKFVVLDLTFGMYKVTVSSEGFRTAVYPNIKIEVGMIANLTVKLEVGATAETITVESGTDVLQTTSPAVESVILGRTLRSVPLNNRDVLDFVFLLPGAQQAGSARQGTFNGLPKGALNITMDGLNIQDNLLKSSFGGGMFTIIRPKLDNVEEISVSSGAAGAESAGEGAVQIKFVTRRGTNDYHGSAFEFWRHDSFNANTWINNSRGNFASGPFQGAESNPRARNRLHTFGFNLGGPIIRDKAFFFFSYEDFRFPGSQPRNNRVLTLEAQQGLFRYTPSITQGAAPNAFTTCDANPAPTQQCVLNLFGVAGANALPNTVDALTQSMFNIINPIVANGRSTGDLFRDRFIYDVNAGQRRWFPTMRLDWNVTDKLRWHGVGNFNRFISSPDTLNRFDAPFPGITDEGGQFSNRYALTTAVNWEIAPTLTYEMRLGRQGSVVQFTPETLPGVTGSSLYPGGFRLLWPQNLNNLHSRPSATDLQGIASRSLPSSRTTPVLQWGNNIGWLKGKHSMNFGTNLTVITSWDGSYGSAGIPNITLGLVNTDPALAHFSQQTATAGFIAGINTSSTTTGAADTTTQTQARDLYALLTARVNQYSGSNNVDEITKQYQSLASLTRRDRQNEFGVYATDQWRVFPELTVTAGLRWEFQGIPFNRNGIYTSPTYADIWGRSGVGNFFQPGANSGVANGQLEQRSKNIASRYMNAWAPSLGFAWTPKIEADWYRWIFGGANKSVIRGGYSIAYTREGFTHFPQFAGSSPGLTQSLSLTAGTNYCTATISCANLSDGFPPTLTIAGTPTVVPLNANPSSFSFPVPLSNFTFTSGINLLTYDPKIKPPYVQSWQLSWQREITPSTVVEARYTGNHGTRLWRSYNINEPNIFENGFLQEFMGAKSNLDICVANAAACTAAQTAAGLTGANVTVNNFNNWGLPGQVPLPIFTASFSAVPGTTTGQFATGVNTGSAAAQINGTNGFRNTNFVTWLNQGQAGRLANGLNTSTYTCRFAGNQLAACQGLNGLTNPLGLGSLPANFFVANPDLITPGAFILTNDANSTYNAFQLEVRRRMSKGLQLNFNYAFSKSLTDRYDDSAISNLGFTTLRDKGYSKGLAPSDITHTMRMFWIYEMPFGPGKRWSSSNGIVNRVIGGWEFLGVVAWQTGRPFLLQSGRQTLTFSDSGVETTLTRKQLQKLVKIHKVNASTLSSGVTPRSFVYFLDPSLIGAAGAFPTGSSTSASANPAFLSVPTTPGVLGQRIFLHGPKFFKPDFTIVKKTSITERINTEFRAEFFNAVNNTNWLVGGPSAIADQVNITSTSFGQTTNFLNDLGNQDPGPRMIQFVLRINF